MDFSKDPNAVKMVNGLSERESYFPCVFGVNVLERGFILWTSNRDSELRFLFDIYDKDFRLIGRNEAYNWVCRNSALTSRNRFYLLDLGSDDMEFKKKIGRLSPFEYASRVLVYEISP